jgi:uncharacterized protein (DUF1330 family)
MARGASPEVDEADWNQPENVQVNMDAFPTMEHAHAWYSSPEYAKALAVMRRTPGGPGAVHG